MSSWLMFYEADPIRRRILQSLVGTVGGLVWAQGLARRDSMGIWTKLFGGADGIREVMRESYDKHVRLSQRGEIPLADLPHSLGLYGALGSRYRARGKPVMEDIGWEVLIRGELSPFMLMKETEAVEALAEYVVYKELPQKARITWLKELINSSLRSCKDDSKIAMATVGLINQVAWCSLLEPETMKIIERAMEKLQKS